MRLTFTLFVFASIAAVALGVATIKLGHEVRSLQNALTASRNTPCNLTKERTPEEMATRRKARKIDEAWVAYKQGGPKPCPDWGICVND
ncbi:hypothetical protein LCGC14_1155320 [marine sediment metagenome]|uniref:Uncharacterized protein n=1 Tax=marine sediment metagenome TaxID=412755 RepID=A0A0F9MHD1_9ZZZZ